MRAAFLLAIGAATLSFAQPARATLVQVRAGAARAVRSVGGRAVAPELRVWTVRPAGVSRLRRDGLLVRAEPDRILRASASALDEPLASDEWWRSAIGADVAAAPGPGRPVTIVDSGLDISHEEFANRANTSLLNDQTTSLEDDDHGTEVASVVAAPVNGVGVAGVYPRAVLRSWDASPLGFITTASAVRGIVEAARRGAGVINLSFGGDDKQPLLQQAILYAFRHGTLVVAASGNDGLDGSPLSYPAAYPHVLTVGASDESNHVASFSSQSPFVDLAAPGQRIPVAEPVDADPFGYVLASGTSFSSPMVAGSAAWVWTMRPDLDNTQLFDVMRFSAHDIDAPGYDAATGFGLLNIPSAVAFPAPARDPLEPNDDIDQVSTTGLFTGGSPAVVTPARRTASIAARLDRREDPRDVYRAYVPAHGSLTAVTSDGTVDLRILPTGARSLGAVPLGSSAHSGTAVDSVTVRNRAGRGVFLYVDVRPDASAPRTAYTLRVTASARR